MKKDKGFVKISYLNQENKNTSLDYKQLLQIKLHVVQVLPCFVVDTKRYNEKTLLINWSEKCVKN